MRNLAIALGTARPIYGLHPLEDGREAYRGSVQETARIYQRGLMDFDPKGPYLLLGHSAHGFYAIELARLLRAAGKEVSFLGLLDTYAPGPKLQANLLERVKLHQDNLRDKNIFGVLKYMQLSAQRFSMRRRYAVAGESLVKRYERLGEVQKVRELLISSYKPEPYDGPVTLFSATQRPSYLHQDPMGRWKNIFTGKYELVSVEGTHMSMLEPPLVAALADKILESIRKSAFKAIN